MTVQQFLDYFISSNKMDTKRKHCMKVDDVILLESDYVPFSGSSRPIFIYCLDIIVSVKYNIGKNSISASNLMTIGDLRYLFYRQYIRGNSSKNDVNSYRLFNVTTKGMQLLDDVKQLQDLIKRGNLNLELAQPLFVNFKGKMNVDLKRKFKTVGDFLNVLLYSRIEM